MGYGSMANATKIYKGEQSLITMLEQLMSKIHQLFFVWKTDVLQQDDLVFYSTYIRAITLTMSHLPVLNEVIFVFDLKPCPTLKGNFLRALRSVSEAKLSKPNKVFAIEDFPTPC